MHFKSFKNRLNFAFGNNPTINKKIEWQRFIPDPYQSVLLIGADFELAWAWQYAKRSSQGLGYALEKARMERENVPELIKLSDAYSIPMTWAVVGHLLLESCGKNGLPHSNLPRLPFFENEFWRYGEGDWFQHDPCSNFKDDPEWYCPDLIRAILDAKVKHEIGCHTFSHIDCQGEVCPSGLMQAELQECKKYANEWGIELKSFVHPGHVIGNVSDLIKEGFTNYRTNFRNVLGYPKKHDNGLWEFEQTTEIVYRKNWSVKYHISRYITIIKRAIKSNTVCVFWFHPSLDSRFMQRVFYEVFSFIDENRDKIWVTTHSEYVDWLNTFCHK